MVIVILEKWPFMSPAKILKNLLKKLFRVFGADIVRTRNSPELTMLGLRAIQFTTIIDVGANTGQFATTIRHHFPHAQVYCFEPLPAAFNELEKWAAAQGGYVTAINKAIGDEEGSIEMWLHEDHTPSSSLLETTGLTEEYYPITGKKKKINVEQTTLDAALSGVSEVTDQASVTLVKMDVQGYEDRVIAGGENTLRNAKACLLEISLDTLYENQAEFKGLLLQLDKIGYRYAGNYSQNYADDGHVVFIDAVFINKNSK